MQDVGRGTAHCGFHDRRDEQKVVPNMAVTDEEFKQLRDAVRDLASHLAAALDEIDAALAGGTDGDLSSIRAGIQRTKSHIARVRVTLES
jgi:hypothetical protein